MQIYSQFGLLSEISVIVSWVVNTQIVTATFNCEESVLFD